MQKRALKKFLHAKIYWRSKLTFFTLVLCPQASTDLQDFAFLSRHICLKEYGVNSGQQGFYRF
jgi:hypothetical protein